LPDTILSRCVIIRMRRRSPEEAVEPYRRRVHAPEGEKLRKQLERWSKLVIEGATAHWPEMPEGINDRDADVWEALLSVADAAGGDWPERARVAAVALVALSRERVPSLGIRLLADLRQVFGEADTMATEGILAALHGLDESPWADLKGKPLNDRGLAARLRPYDVRPKVVRIGDATPRGYVRADLHDAWLRYLGPPPDGSATTATSVTPDPSARPTNGSGSPICVTCGRPGDDPRDALTPQDVGGRRVWIHSVCKPFWEKQGRPTERPSGDRWS
jgi:hypothetical protein